MSLNSIKISVIIPFYKGKKWLKEAIDSVLNQTYSNLEIIVINDGSIEDISDLEIRYKQKVCFIKVQNGGAGSARNIGINNSTGTYVAFLDSDDLWLKTKIEQQLNFMIENNFVWSHSDYIRFSDNNFKEVYVKAKLLGQIFPKCLVWNPIATPCVIVKTDVLKLDSLGFEVGKIAGEDNYLWEKLGERYELGYIPIALSKVRIHGENSAFQAHLQLKGRGETLDRMKLKKHQFENKFLYYYLYAILIYCKYTFYLFYLFFKNNNSEPKNFDYVFKPLYGIAYIHFRIIRYFI